MRPNVVITGVSTGIGLDAARLLIERGYRVFGSVRSQVDADRVGAALGPHFTPLLFDVTDEAAIATAAEKVRDAIGDEGLCALVNNSGISGAGPLMHFPLDEMRKMFEVNVFGLLAVTQAFLPLLGARRDCPHPPGRIINISSISGGLVFPFVGAYGASKHAVEALTDGLRRELGLYNIHVIAIEPGNIRTEFTANRRDVSVPAGDETYAAAVRKAVGLMERDEANGASAEKAAAAIEKVLSGERMPRRRTVGKLEERAGSFAKRLIPYRLFERAAKSSLGV